MGVWRGLRWGGAFLLAGSLAWAARAEEASVSTATVAGISDSSAQAGERVVDDFERPVPQRAFLVYQADESSLALTASREAFKGAYSMQMEYRFLATQIWGSWVTAHRALQIPLDWTGATSLDLMVKGDGSENLFRITFLEEDGGTWQYIDQRVLNNVRWTRVSVPMSAFVPFGTTDKDKKLDLSRIKSYEIGILTRGSDKTAGAKTAQGRIYVDDLVIKGPLRNPGQASPTPEGAGLQVPISAPSAPQVARVNFAVSGLAEYTNTPEQKSRVIHFASLVADAGVEKFGARVDFTSKGQEFGEAAAYVGSTVTSVNVQNPVVEMRSVEFHANNLSPLLRHMVVGNIFADYSIYTFSPLFGFKGVSAEGDYKQFNYNAFVLKHLYDSYTAGTRMRFVGPWWYLEGIAVNWQGQAVLPGGSVVDGSQLKPVAPEIIDARTVARDFVATGEARARFLDERLTLDTIVGQNRYQVYADVDYSDPFNPIYLRELDQSVNKIGNMVRASARSQGLVWKGLSADYEFRRVDTEFKPRYRQDPFGFDNQESDQQGHHFRLSQWDQGWVYSAEYDQMRRLSNHDYGQYKAGWGIGRYGFRGVDVGFNQTITRSRYIFTSDRSSFTTDEDQRLIANELFLRAQLLPNLIVWFRPRHELKHDYKVDNDFTQDSLQSRLDYFATTNVRLSVEQKTTRYADPAFEPTAFPFDDNFFKMTLEVTF